MTIKKTRKKWGKKENYISRELWTSECASLCSGTEWPLWLWLFRIGCPVSWWNGHHTCTRYSLQARVSVGSFYCWQMSISCWKTKTVLPTGKVILKALLKWSWDFCKHFFHPLLPTVPQCTWNSMTCQRIKLEKTLLCYEINQLFSRP